MAPVHVDEILARTERSDAPTGCVRDSAELVQEIRDLGGLADRVTADQRSPVDDAVGEQRATRRREHVALVATQREVRETVASLIAHDPTRLHALLFRVIALPRERPQPEIERAEGQQR